MLDQRVDELVDLEGDVGVGLEVQFPVEVINERHYESAEDLNEKGIAEVGGPRGLVLEMQAEEGPKVDEGQFCNNFEGLMPIAGLDDAGDVVHVPAEGFAGA